ncbi:MAG: hypothetical protein ACRDT0_14115 [Pseudonocardiaceae bacterium]
MAVRRIRADDRMESNDVADWLTSGERATLAELVGEHPLTAAQRQRLRGIDGMCFYRAVAAWQRPVDRAGEVRWLEGVAMRRRRRNARRDAGLPDDPADA